MTNPTLERAARALCLSYYSFSHEKHDAETLANSEWREWVPEARAVLMAVRDDAPTKAMAESRATDDEGQFEPLCDLIGFSGENKTRTVLRQAWADGVRAILAEGE